MFVFSKFMRFRFPTWFCFAVVSCQFNGSLGPYCTQAILLRTALEREGLGKIEGNKDPVSLSSHAAATWSVPRLRIGTKEFWVVRPY